MPAPRSGSEEIDLPALLIASVVDYAIFALDVDGCVLTWNAGAERLKGYRSDEIIGRHFSTFYPAAEIERGWPDRELAIAVAQGRFEDEGWRVRKDGSWFWANVVITALRGADGRLLGFGKVTRDLTERKAGEDLLRESEERFRLLVSAVADYAIFLLDPDGTVASWNVGAERLKGYRADEILGRHFSVFYSNEDREHGVPEDGLRAAVEDGRWENEGWRLRKDGSRFWADVVITALRGADGGLRGFTKITRDLTDRKSNEDALRGILAREREATARLQELDRMKTDLVAIVAHDLRGPVAVIQNLLELLQDDWVELPDEQRLDFVRRLARQSESLGALVDDVFDLARIEAGHLVVDPVTFDVAEVVDRVIADAEVSSPGRKIRREVQEPLQVVADEHRVWQILSNLLSNAIKFSPVDTPIDLVAERSGSEVLVTVVDRGSGISQEDEAVAFSRFGRVAGSGAAAGSGLGLFIARSLAEAQDGRLDLDSQVGQGSRFILALPRGGLGLPVDTARYKRFTLLHSNDMHGDFLAEVKEGTGTLVGGLAVLSGYLNEVRATERNVIYAIAGDMLQGSMIDSEFQGVSTFEIMNYLAPDVVTLGNHELDYGFRHLLFLEKIAAFPIINANLYIKQYQQRIFRPYHVIERDGFSIMFIGVVTDEVLASLKMDTSIASLISLEDAAQEVGKVCNAFRNDDIDLTVLMTHIGFEQDKVLAELLDPAWGVDIIIGGHSHTVLEQPAVVNGVQIAQAAVGTDQIGRFDLTVDDDTNSIVECAWQLVPITKDLCEPDRELERFIDTFKDEVDRKYNRVLTKLKRKLSHPQRETETEIGNLFADILGTADRVDLVLLGSGSIRQPELGPLVTLGQLNEIFTFDGSLHRVSIDGEKLLRLFAHVMRVENRVPGESNCFQVNAGVAAVYDDTAGTLVSLTIAGEPVDPARAYAVCLQDYSLSSSDSLLGLTVDELGPAKVIATSSRDVLSEHLAANQLLDAVLEGRLQYRS